MVTIIKSGRQWRVTVAGVQGVGLSLESAWRAVRKVVRHGW